MPATQSIPQANVERLISTLTALVSAAREAAAASAQSSVWQRKVLPGLEKHLAAVTTAADRFAAGDEQLLAAEASSLRFLAREMDGYSLHFAGDAFAHKLQEQRRMVVYAAWQLCQAAGAV